MEKEEFIKLLPKLIREDDEVKGAIITALSGVVATKDDIAAIIEHFDRKFEAIDKRFEAIDKRFEAIDKRFEASDKRLEQLIQQMNTGFEEARKERKYIDAKIDTLSGRSGTHLEDTILYLLNDNLIQENIQASKITKEILIDREGKIFWEDYATDIDVLIQDGKTILIEVKYHPDNRDAYHFLKNAELFEFIFNKKYDNLLLICLEIKKVNLEQIEKQGIRIIAGKIVQ